MDNNAGLQVQMFNDRVRAMNQTQRRELTLTAQEARNLHAEIFDMLARIAALTERPESDTVSVVMDGGRF